ncbi:hypothetical protein F5Y12DRAFT_711545 [Xylaria sp. FL1777]|nr:hypothetical protein F5Y12DRAFT_711545 [Xylaria sp. FL1777]
MGPTPTLPRNRRQLAAYVGVLILLVGAFHLLYESRRVSFSADYPVIAPSSVDENGHHDPCASLGGLEDVFVIVRTGSNEVDEKLPPLINTTLPCFRHYGIWSDLEEDFAGLHIADALDEIDSGLLEHHPDFAYYRFLQEQGKGAVSSDEVVSWANAPNTGLGRDTPAWKLDKWKFLPVARKAYRQNPTRKWYIFIEGDTYIFWTSLLAWLSHIDASRPLYIGRQMNIGSAVFAYGGAGIIVSNPAMEKLIERHAEDRKAYNELTINEWAGDFILSKVMSDAGVKLSPVWPTLEGDMPALMDMKSVTLRGIHLWCYNAATYHHMSPDDIYSYYAFEQRWISTKTKFPRHGDIFRELVFPRMKDQISDWDNLSADVQSEDASFEQCREICENQADCLQFSLTSRTCKTSSSAKLGKEQPQTQDSSDRVDSGWILTRVESFMKKMEASCSGQGWVTP